MATATAPNSELPTPSSALGPRNSKLKTRNSKLADALVIVGLAMVVLSTAAGALLVSSGGARIAPRVAPLPRQWERLGEGHPAVAAPFMAPAISTDSVAPGDALLAEAPRAREAAPQPAAPANHVVIPRIGIATEIVDVALKGKEWPVPKFIVGHLAESANPGDVGNAVFAGHLLSLSSGNVFARLGELEVGDELGFFSANGDRLFRVIDTRLVSNRDISVLAARPGKATVTLITCAGAWVPREQDYDQRRVVVAELVNA